jgi:AcrR family transcriptional regulator
MATNLERSTLTRQRLIQEARILFSTHGYAATGTELILQQADCTRGAMYHHFADKLALFEAICRQICEEAALAIQTSVERVTPQNEPLSPRQQLIEGSLAWMQFMLQSDIRQIMLIDAPTALGWLRWQALEKDFSTSSLQEGIEAAIAVGQLQQRCSTQLLTTAINGALNALALHAGAPQSGISTQDWQRAVHALWEAQFSR